MDKKISYKNKSVSYRVIGQGNPVVFLHGFAEDKEIWARQVKVLENNYQLLIPDLPGSGGSESTGDVSMDAMADTIKYILNEESISETILIGHSMGGYVSIAFADKYPESLKALGFFHSSSYADTEEKKLTRKKNFAFIQKNGSHAFLQQSTPGLFSEASKMAFPGIVESVIEGNKDFGAGALADYQLAMMERPDRREVLTNIVKPVLFIIGEHDSAIPFKDSMEQCHLPALSYIHVLKQSGHMGMLEETEKSNHILQNFLSDTL